MTTCGIPAEGENIVTPRSWCDLSRMIGALEAAGEAPGRLLFEQYIQCERICERFSLYYTMCENVSRSFQLDEVLFDGDLSAVEHFASAPFDEALCCAEMLSDRLSQLRREASDARKRANRLNYFVEAAMREAQSAQLAKVCQEQLQRREHALEVRRQVGALSAEEEVQESALHSRIRGAIAAMLGSDNPDAILKAQAEESEKTAEKMEQQYAAVRQNAQRFAEKAFSGNSFQAILCRGLLTKNFE